MRKQNRLRVLHVRHAGHWQAEICVRLLDDHRKKFDDLPLQARSSILHKQTKIRRDKFVAAAPSVQLPSKRPEFIHQGTFNKVMHVFRSRAIEKLRIAVALRRDRVKRLDRVANLDFSQNADLLQRARPRPIDRQLVRQQPPVERKRTLKRVERLIRLALKTPAPEAVVLAFVGG